jgi:microcin C transport system substrate-binding protein
MMPARRSLRLLGWALLLLLAPSLGYAEEPVKSTGPQHALALYGQPKYPADFAHVGYVNPQAPKGGEVRMTAMGSFDSLNPYILKGQAADGLGLTVDTLMVSSQDEPFSQYGLLAETVEVAADRKAVTFTLRRIAKFHDGTPVTAGDVVFTFETLKKLGHPSFRVYYKDVVGVVALDDRRVRFDLATGQNRELPLIVGQLPVLPKHYYDIVKFDQTTLRPPLGNGSYRVKTVDAGRQIVLERVADYWGRDLPINRGRFNFDRIIFDYYRDSTAEFQAFKAGQSDFRQENVAKQWATAYDFPAVKDGRVIKTEIPHQLPQGMQGFAFNLRRPLFQDVRVRRALGLMFDFEWTNQRLFYGAYKRSSSYFSNSVLAASGVPTGLELALLEPWRAQLPPALFVQPFAVPRSDGSGFNRDAMAQALELLAEAGWVVRDQQLVRADTGQPFRFEILLSNPAFERVTEPFALNLRKLGIAASIRTVDSAQYQNRMQNFDFDMTVEMWGSSLSPGNEQRGMWTSAAADQVGSRNSIGVKSPVVDALVDAIIQANSLEDLTAAAHALDRVLLWGYYVIPNWHLPAFRVAYWDKFERPATSPLYGLGFPDTWWAKAAKQ